MKTRRPPRFLPGRNKEPERFYLLPGMGGRAMREKHRRMLWWSIACGLVISAILTVILYLISRHP